MRAATDACVRSSARAMLALSLPARYMRFRVAVSSSLQASPRRAGICPLDSAIIISPAASFEPNRVSFNDPGFRQCDVSFDTPASEQ